MSGAAGGLQAAELQQMEAPMVAFQPSFSTGEIAPALWYRSDWKKWGAACSLMSNFIVTPQGSVARRPGLQWVGACKFATGLVRLIPFQFNTEQQYVIEAGANYMRFIQNGGYLMTGGGAPYEIATPYAAADLSGLVFVQSADVLTIVHPGYAPQELERLGVLNWQLLPMNIGTQLATPAIPAVTSYLGANFPSGGAPAAIAYSYAITANSTVNKDESQLSPNVTCSNVDTAYYTQYGTTNTLTWAAVAGADFYKVYRFFDGVWSFVASTTALMFIDTGVAPDTALSPPTGTNPFAGNNWPGVVGYYQERRVFGGSAADPETIWTSKSGNYTNFDVSTPEVDDDAITYTLAARQVNQIRHLIPLTDLIIMTGGSGWRVDGSKGAVTPSNFDVAPQTFPGVSMLDPLVIGNYILFVEAKGSSVREVVYNLYANSYVSEDRGVFSNHLLVGHQIVSWAYADSPQKVVWMVREDGVVLSLTYLKEQDVYAWAQHNSPGAQFLAVTVISETVNGVAEDVPYFVVQRTVSGALVSSVERMHSALLGTSNTDIRYAWYVDSGLQYNGAPVTSVSGLAHLEGQAVVILADGVTSFGMVAGGAVALPVPASIVTVGLAYQSLLCTLPLDSPRESLFGVQKRISKVRLAVQTTAQLAAYSRPGDTPIPFVGLQVDDPNDPSDSMITGNSVVSGVQEVKALEGWDRNGQVYITTNSALPAAISSMSVVYEAFPP